MKKLLLLMLTAVILCTGLSAAADIVLPSGMTEIGAEAFRNDPLLTGVLSLPSGVTLVGDHAFSGTGLHGLVVPAGTQTLGDQAFADAAYVYVSGASTQVGSLTGVQCVLGPAGSPAQAAAQASGADFVPLSELASDGTFYYAAENGSLTLLCPVNPGSVGASAVIPAEVEGQPVTAVSDYGFMGCDGLSAITLPATVESVPSGALADCPDAEITYSAQGQVIVRSVTADVTEGAQGSSITWNVSVAADNPVASYQYTLTLNGREIKTAKSTSASFTYETEEAGEYQLAVVVTDKAGSVGRGVSDVLYIATQAMVMTVPETLQAGMDLVIEVGEVEGASRYSVYVTDDATGEALAFSSLTKAGRITVRGYLLEQRSLRVTGYVYGNDFRYTVPTVEIVNVTGDRGAAPAIPAQEPIVYRMGEISLMLSETSSYAVRYQYRYSDGSLSAQWTRIMSAGEESYFYADGSEEDWADGGAVLLEACVQQADGSWSAWSDVTEVEVLAAPMLDQPVLTAPAAANAGMDLTVHISEVENAGFYQLIVFRGYKESWDRWDDEDVLLEWGDNSAGSVTIPGYHLSAGTYTLYLRADGYDAGYLSPEPVCQRLDVTGVRPGAPVISADKTELYYDNDRVTLTISAPGADGAVILEETNRNGNQWISSTSTVSLDENGSGSYRVRTYYQEDWVGATLTLKVSAIIDGVWSGFGEVSFLLKDREDMACTVITCPETLPAGQDLTFSFAAVENAQSYRAELYRSYDQNSFKSWSGSDAAPDTVLTMPGYALTQGNYRLVVTAFSDDNGSSVTETAFTVTGSRPAAPAITADLAEVHIKEKITFAIDTAGAEKVHVERDAVLGSITSYYGDADITVVEDVTRWSHTFFETSVDYSFTFSFSVKKDGVWSAWKRISYTVQDVPTLPEAVIHCQETWPAGADIRITFDAVEHADEYRVILTRPDGTTYSAWPEEPKELSWKGYDLEPGVYTLTVTAMSDAYRSSTAETSFEILGSRAAAPTVTVDKAIVEETERFTFTIDTAGAESLYYRRYNSETSYNSGAINVLEDTTLWSDSISSAGERRYIFSALKDGCWSAWSEPILITITEAEALDAPALTMPDTLNAGEDLTVTVGAVEGANYYYVYLYNSKGSQVTYEYISGSSQGTVTISGYRLGAGSYTVEARAYGNAGQNSATRELTVIAGARPEAPAVLADTDIGRVSVAYGFTIDTAGAQQAAVRYYREDNTNSITYRTLTSGGDSTSWSTSNSSAGYTWCYAFAVQVDGVWSPWSETKRVTITDREQLDRVTLSVPSSVQTGEDVAISFTAVDNADSYTVTLCRPDGSSSDWWGYPGVEHVFSGYQLDAGTYTVQVRATGAAYESSTAEKNFTVSGEWLAAPAVSVDVSEVFTNETYTFLIDAPGAQELCFRAVWSSGSTTTGRLNAYADQTAWETSSGSSGSRTYSFAACTDGRWTAWSSPIAITVNARPALPAVTFTAPESIAQGEDLTVTVNAVAGASYYYVTLYNSRGEQISSRYLNAAGDAVFQGYRLSAGSFRLEVSAYGSSGGYSEADAALTISSAVLADAPAVTPPDSTTVPVSTNFSFLLDTAGAQAAAVRYYRIGAPNDLNYSAITVKGDATTWTTSRYNSGYTYAYSFCVQVDGVWSQWSSFTEITIE